MAGVIQPITLARGYGAWTDADIEHGVELSGTTFKRGNVLILSSGQITQAGANPTSGITGIATHAKSGTAGTKVIFNLPLPNMLFSITVDGALSTNAPGTGKPSDFVIGTAYGVSIDGASGLEYLDSANTNDCARVVAYDTDQTSVINGRVYICFLQSTTIYT